MKKDKLFLYGIVIALVIAILAMLSVNCYKFIHNDVSYIQAQNEIKDTYLKINQLNIETQKGDLNKINEILSEIENNKKQYLIKFIPKNKELIEEILVISIRNSNEKIFYKFYNRSQLKQDSLFKLLVIASSFGENRIVSTLLKDGANVNASVKNENEPYVLTPLMAAVRYGNVDTVKVLLSNGATVTNEIFKQSIENLNSDITTILIENGADINYVYSQYMGDGFYLLVENGLTDVAKKYLYKAKNVDVATAQGKTTPLLMAAKWGDYELVKLLIDRGANINSVDSSDCGILIYAVQSNNIELINYLLNKGYDINKPDRNGKMPIAYAATYANIDTFKYLISKGAILTKDTDEKSPAYSSIRADNNLVLKLILEKLNVREDVVYMTKLMPYTARHNNIEAFRFFLKNGAIVNEKTLYWLTSDNCDSIVPSLNRSQIAALVDEKYPNLISNYEEQHKKHKSPFEMMFDFNDKDNVYELPRQAKDLKKYSINLYENIKFIEKRTLNNWNTSELSKSNSGLVEITADLNKNGDIAHSVNIFGDSTLEWSNIIQDRKFYHSITNSLENASGNVDKIFGKSSHYSLIRMLVKFDYNVRTSSKKVHIEKVEVLIR